MSRIQKAYETRLYWLLQQVGTRKLQKGLAWWLFRAQKLASETGISQASALTKCFEKISSKPRIAQRSPAAHADRFFCDAGLGGLARWLRAAGYEAC